MGGFLLHSRSCRRCNGGGGLLNRSGSHRPRPGHSQRSYVKLKWGVGRDSDIRVRGPKRLGGLFGADLATRVK
jgi:hypothetical protein